MKKASLIVLICVFAVTAALAGALITLNVLNEWRIDFEPVPEPMIVIEAGDEFSPPEISAFLRGRFFAKEGIPAEVTSEGETDSSRPGEYVLSWSAELSGRTNKTSSHVIVRDTTPPEIALIPEEREYILPGTAYDDPGFSATDSIDGDITGRVKIEREDDGKFLTLYYSVTDLSGNAASAERVVKYDDPFPPTLTLSGDGEITFYAGRQTYGEPGYAADDNVSGDITDRVKVDGSVDSETPGVYTLTYSVEDDWGNRAEATRTVTVVEPPKPRKVTVQKDYPSDGPLPDKVIYLTFDDGPGPYTAELLDILAKHNVKATFFVCGTGYTDLIAREEAEGHSVGVHCYSHMYGPLYASEEAYFADLWAMNEIVKEKTGSYTSLLRFPGGSSNTVSRFNPGIMTRLAAAVTEAGFTYFDWNVSSLDAGGTTDTGEVFLNVTNGIAGKNVSIVLQHDTKGFSVAAVDDIIEWGLENGYVFLPLTPTSPAVHHNIAN